MNTIKLYEQDAYQTSFMGKVMSCDETEKNTYKVILDQTAFFPEEGGQSPDKGTINGVQVVDVQIEKDKVTGTETIIHTLTGKVPVDEWVEGIIQWQHRFSNMQQHSGEHIFSGLVHSTFGYENVGFHLSDSGVTMDFNGVLTEQQIADIEYQVNEAITKNIEVEVTYPGKEELTQMNYRSKIVIQGQTRIVTIPGYDRCACCAPHVRRTGEIGMLKVVNTQNYKGGVRISILCGFRALADYEEKLTQVSKISALLSAKPELVADAVEKMKNDLTITRQQLVGVKQELMIQKIGQMPEDNKNSCLFERETDAMVMRVAVNAMMEKHTGYCGIFAGTDETGYHYMIGIKEGDARIMGNLLKEKFQGKGGGKPEMIQGSLVGEKDAIEELFLSCE